MLESQVPHGAHQRPQARCGSTEPVGHRAGTRTAETANDRSGGKSANAAACRALAGRKHDPRAGGNTKGVRGKAARDRGAEEGRGGAAAAAGAPAADGDGGEAAPAGRGRTTRPGAAPTDASDAG